MLYNNSSAPHTLDNFTIPQNKKIVLINNGKDLVTGEVYKSMSAIYRDALSFVNDSEIITHSDDDDLYFPSHISVGVKGMKKAYSEGKLAFKPYFSWFLYMDKCSLEHNNLEPSIFVDAKYLKETLYGDGVASFHTHWLQPLKDKGKIIEDPSAPSTLIYNWHAGHNTYKLSGSGDDTYSNMKRYRDFHQDYGDRVLTPAPQEEIDYYFNIIKANA